MAGRAGALVAGAWSALTVPRWLGGAQLDALLRPPADARPGAEPARGAVRAARAAIRLLGALPGGPWRNTCLYRSAAETLVLRRYGVPAVLCIGVKSEDGGIVAHAWVRRTDRDGPPADPQAAHHTPLVVR